MQSNDTPDENTGETVPENTGQISLPNTWNLLWTTMSAIDLLLIPTEVLLPYLLETDNDALDAALSGADTELDIISPRSVLDLDQELM